MTDTQSARIACEILSMLRQRAGGESICPEDVARRLPLDPNGDEDWRDWLPSVSAVLGQMSRAGMIVVTQDGESIDPHTTTGPVRLAMPEFEHSVG